MTEPINTAAIPATVAKASVRMFTLDLLERAAKTAAQTALATFGAGAVNVWHMPWHEAAGITLGSALISVLTSIASAGRTGTASLTRR